MRLAMIDVEVLDVCKRLYSSLECEIVFGRKGVVLASWL
jgi:hypothetical protein